MTRSFVSHIEKTPCERERRTGKMKQLFGLFIFMVVTQGCDKASIGKENSAVWCWGLLFCSRPDPTNDKISFSFYLTEKKKAIENAESKCFQIYWSIGSLKDRNSSILLLITHTSNLKKILLSYAVKVQSTSPFSSLCCHFVPCLASGTLPALACWLLFGEHMARVPFLLERLSRKKWDLFFYFLDHCERWTWIKQLTDKRLNFSCFLHMHKAKRTPRQISLLPSVSRPRSIIRQLRKLGQFSKLSNDRPWSWNRR